MTRDLNNISDSALLKLIMKVCDGFASVEESELLKQYLLNEKRAVHLYLEYTNLNAQLNWQHRGLNELLDSDELFEIIERDSPVIQDAVECVNAGVARRGGQHLKRKKKRLHSSKYREAGLFIPAKLLVAACFLVLVIPTIVVISLKLNENNHDVPRNIVVHEHVKTFATVQLFTEGTQVFNHSKKMLKTADALGKGQYQIRSGKIEVLFDSGALVKVSGPAIIEIESAMTMRLLEGKIAVVVPARAYGFMVNTPQMGLVDIGTSFGVAVHSQGKTSEVHVLQGEVEMQPVVYDGKSEKRRITTGQAQQVDRAGAIKQIDFAGDDYLAMFSVDEANNGDGYLSWLKYRREVSGNKSLMVFLDFEELDYGNENVLNHAGNRVQCKREGCFDVQGRFPGKRALALQKHEDAIDLNIAKPLQSFSLGCWVGFDEIGDSALLMSDGFGKPNQELRWQFHDNGDFRLTIMRDVNESYRYYAKGVIRPEHFGKWIHLFTTYDGIEKRVKHYVNGQLVAEHQLTDDRPVHIGQATIGNWKHGNGERRFVGRLDEFVLYEEVLKSEAVNRLYQNGMPRSVR